MNREDAMLAVALSPAISSGSTVSSTVVFGETKYAAAVFASEYDFASSHAKGVLRPVYVFVGVFMDSE